MLKRKSEFPAPAGPRVGLEFFETNYLKTKRMKICTNFLNLLKVCMCVALAFAALETRAQGEAFTVSGTVKDASGQPVIGATVFDTTTQKEM